MAGDPVTGVTIFQLEEGLDSGPVALSRSRGDTAGRHARHARRAALRARGDAADRGLRPGGGGRAGAATPAGGGRHLRREDRPGGAAPRPGAAGVRAGTHRARAHARHRGVPGARGRRAPGGRGGARRGRSASAPAQSSWTTGACSWDAPTGRSSCFACGPRADGRCRPPTTCAATGPARDWPAESCRTDARRCAYAVVRRVFEQDAYADRAFRAEADRLELDGRDRAFAMSLAYGVVQRRATLDHVIESLSDRAAERIDAPVLAALRLGVHQLAVHGRRRRPRGGHGVRRPRQGGTQPRARFRERGAAAGRRGRGGRLVDGARRVLSRGGRAAPLTPAVGGAGLVGPARAARCGGPDADRQRAGRERGAGEHPARRPATRCLPSWPARALRRAPRRTSPRASCSTTPTTCTAPPRSSAAP